MKHMAAEALADPMLHMLLKGLQTGEDMAASHAPEPAVQGPPWRDPAMQSWRFFATLSLLPFLLGLTLYTRPWVS